MANRRPCVIAITSGDPFVGNLKRMEGLSTTNKAAIYRNIVTFIYLFVVT
jgi:hypothetical protein